MPQLNPSPWLFVMLFGWAAFLLSVPHKVIAFSFCIDASPPTLDKQEMQSWNWPWH
uniref:ATP synthase F0 subunit 8 n=1 Tax=Chromis acares TaxID=997966 RepID=UPI001BEF3E18|nr:ATP synthase F0 subunit 8 [Chromis acares]QUJ18282.1 ATP synthase protein 8 [Chromis acares]WMY90608.1 ATP synthase F0 subunit 8 [Chromis acares]WNH23857.1 ATP synthase F0 subunit 8 [Chromis acares]